MSMFAMNPGFVAFDEDPAGPQNATYDELSDAVMVIDDGDRLTVEEVDGVVDGTVVAVYHLLVDGQRSGSFIEYIGDNEDEDPAVPTDTWQTYDGVTGKVHTGLTHGEAMEVFSSFAQRAA